MGHHARVLDLLHVSDSAIVCGAGAWHGSGRILEGGVNAENALGEIRILETSAVSGLDGTGSRIRQEVTNVTQNPIDMDKNRPIM